MKTSEIPVATTIDLKRRSRIGVAMLGSKGVFGSKRSVFCLIMVAIATVFVFTRHLSGDSWVDFAKWITTALVASHTVTGVTQGRSAQAQAPVALAPPPVTTPT